MILRDYQEDAVQALFDYFARADGHPLVEAPTGAGKSLIIAEFVQRALRLYPETRIIMLTHVKELVEQNAEKLVALWEDGTPPVGIYSAGLGFRDCGDPIIFGGIQSVYRCPEDFGRRDLIVIDEAHRLPKSGAGMYRTYIEAAKAMNPAAKVVGFTATPYRLDGGYLHAGSDRLFTDIVYSIPVTRLVAEGYLSPVVSREPKQGQIDTDGIATRSGDFVAGELEQAALASNVELAVGEMVRIGTERACRSWLVFACGVDHATEIVGLLQKHGVSAEMVLGSTDADRRAQILEDFKAGALRCLVNVNVLTTGFDAPGVDLLAMMRPTQSTSLYVQIVGRGTRTAPGKDKCIARGQRVLTDRGLVPIEEVSCSDLLWDGCEWVTHDGAVPRGVKETITHEGLTATRDHKVWTKLGLLEFGICAEFGVEIVTAGDGRRTIEVGPSIIPENRATRKATPDIPGNDVPAVWESAGEADRKPAGWDCGMPQLRKPEECTEVAGQSLLIGAAAVPEPKEPRVREVRGSWHRIPVHRPDSDGCLDQGEPRTGPGSTDRPYQQRGALRAGEPSACCSAGQHGEHPDVEVAAIPLVPARATGSKVRRRDPEEAHVLRALGRRDCREVSSPVVQTEREVWDILNAGPRHRFVVEGLLVSNCLVLDYGGNVRRHGPIDRVSPKFKGKGGDAPMKECPYCLALCYTGTRECPDCGSEFPFEERVAGHDATADTAAVMTFGPPEWEPPREVAVQKVEFTKHEKDGKPSSVRVTYLHAAGATSEWWCFDHGGFATKKAHEAWDSLGGIGFGKDSTDDALEATWSLTLPSAITIKAEGKYDRVIERCIDPPLRGPLPGPDDIESPGSDWDLDELPF